MPAPTIDPQDRQPDELPTVEDLADPRVWAYVAGQWRAAAVLSYSTTAVLVRYQLTGRGTGVDTLTHRFLWAHRTEPEPAVDYRDPTTP
jgi:hypothetical protein